jgi:predicted porin
MKPHCIRACVAVAAVVLAVSLAPAAHAIDLAAGDWKFSITGNVNASFIYSTCDSSPHEVDGGLACISTNKSASVSNGLLPAAITFNGSTTQDGYDIGFTFGFYPGITTNDGGSPNLQNTAGPNNVGLGTTGNDVRQVFLTFGNDVMGTVMAGRNIGLFQGDAILNDMTLIGVGAGNGNYAAPPNTSLGSIGLGYIYPDWIAQINYTTPDIGGAKITLGTFAPLNTLNSGQSVQVNKGIPGFQGKIAYTAGNLYLSAAALFQKQRGIDLSLTNPEGFGYSSWAVDLGGKYDFGGLEVAGWYYHGIGVGTTALFNFANDPLTGKPRQSNGFLAQVTYRIDATKLGFNYGQSQLVRADGEVAPTLVMKNSKYTAGLYYSLTTNLTLTAEISYIASVNQAQFQNESRNFDVGAFLKF